MSSGRSEARNVQNAAVPRTGSSDHPERREGRGSLVVNPFPLGGPVGEDRFIGRTEELDQLTRALTEPRAMLLVDGPRRIGKSWLVALALRRVRAAGHTALGVDVAAASTLADAAGRILRGSVQALAPRWPGVASDLANHLLRGPAPVRDAVTGEPTFRPEPARRSASVVEQQAMLGEALDALDRLAESRGQTIGLVLDGFEQVRRMGGEHAEWRLRAVMQRHNRMGHVLVGSGAELRRATTQRSRAFHQLFHLLPVGALDPDRLAAWITERMALHRVEARRAAKRLVDLASPRTGDVVRLAHVAFELCAPQGALSEADAVRALDRVVEQEDDFLRVEWERLTPLQQNVLRAMAAGVEQLFAREVRKQFGLRDTGSVASAVELLIQKQVVLKDGTRYRFDNPFLRHWVLRNAVPDVEAHVQVSPVVEN